MTGTLTLLPNTRESFLEESSTSLTSDGKHPDNAWPSRRVPAAIVGDAARERSFRESLSQIESYRSLAPDWDTYGGLPASDVSVRFVRGLLQALQWLPEISAPYVCPISTGVYVEWRSGHVSLYFETDEDSVLFVMQQADVVVERGEDTAFDVNRAADLVKRFHRAAI